VRAFLGVFALQLFAAPPLPFVVRFDNFPFILFIESVANVSALYSAGGRSDAITADLLAHSFLLVARQPVQEAMIGAFALIDRAKILNAFGSSPPLFDPTSPVADEALAFFHLAIWHAPALPQLVAATGRSNAFIFALISSAKVQFEKSRVLAVIFSVVLQLLAVPEACQSLNDPLPSNDGSYADFLLTVCTEVCPPALWVPFGRIFHTLAPALRTVTGTTATAVIAFFARIADSGDEAHWVWIEAFARIVQKRVDPSTKFRAAIFKARALFESFEGSTQARVGPSAEIILRFVRAAATGKAAQKIDATLLFPEVEDFPRKPTVVTAETLQEWAAWLDELFAKAFQSEIAQLRELRYRREE
jgi:hypothetical protein